MRCPFKTSFFLLLLLTCGVIATSQRQYKAHSVLSSGNWAKIAIGEAGVYKMDAAFLGSLGFTGNLPSGQIRVFGRKGGMLPEGNGLPWTDDLEEVALQVVDGGDGMVSGGDYVLFFTPGAHQWIADTVNRRFTYQKNLYSDKLFYFITVGGEGKRIAAQNAPVPAAAVTAFDERWHHELDTVNFLNSGKEWYGEEFSGAPGKVLSRSFTLPFSDAVAGQPFTIHTQAVARSIGNSSQFNVSINGQAVQQLTIPAISGGQYDLFAQQAQQSVTTAVNSGSVNLSFSFVPGGFNAQGWLNRVSVFCRRPLSLSLNRQLLFRDWNSAGNQDAAFAIANAPADVQVWDVSDPLTPVKREGTLTGSTFTFGNSARRLHEYVAFTNQWPQPQAAGRVPNQDLHLTTAKDYIIITPTPFIEQAQRLAQFHQQKNNLQAIVVTTDQIFNEFAAGVPDPTALKDFVKMYYDRYKSTWAASGKYLLLLGKASFDYKNRIVNNTSFVPAYESVSSLDPLTTYTSDDFFGFLDDEEDINALLTANQLDIGIGRVPVKSVEEAKNFVDKVEAYYAAAAMGPWRNNINFVADDEDDNLHLQDAEEISAAVTATAPHFNTHKIYLDAFRQEGGSAGGRYPQANEVINNNIYNGTLIWNYNGHGGPYRLAEEVVLDQQIVNSWNNPYRLPLLITATCDFAPFDNPLIASLGENLLVRPKTGAIALMTTTRVVFAFSNRILNKNYLQLALQKTAGGHYPTLGEAVRIAKNYTYQTSNDIVNNRKFALLGDPAMTLAFPQLQVKPTLVNSKILAAGSDTLNATETVVVEGEVSDKDGALQSAFNGTVYLSLYDKPRPVTTLGNDADSRPVTFVSPTATVLFKGKATAAGGRFSFRFKLPKDINYQYGFGRLSLYAQDGVRDGNGRFDSVVIGGRSEVPVGDTEGPVIKVFLNDEAFVDGGATHAAPVLIVQLADSSGINIGGIGIDHDIVATLDGDNRQYFVLNNYYESNVDDNGKGAIRFQLPQLTPGPHTLHLKAWDVMNNSAEYTISFTVVETGDLQLNHVLNYPNPFTTSTQFWFEHNQPFTDLKATVDIYTVSGKLIKSIRQTINTPGNRSSEMAWDGRDEYGHKVGRGVYIYRLQVSNSSGKKAVKWERLLILN